MRWHRKHRLSSNYSIGVSLFQGSPRKNYRGNSPVLQVGPGTPRNTVIFGANLVPPKVVPSKKQKPSTAQKKALSYCDTAAKVPAEKEVPSTKKGQKIPSYCSTADKVPSSCCGTVKKVPASRSTVDHHIVVPSKRYRQVGVPSKGYREQARVKCVRYLNVSKS